MFFLENARKYFTHIPGLKHKFKADCLLFQNSNFRGKLCNPNPSGTYFNSFFIIDMTSEISSKLNDTTTDIGDSIFKPCDESIDFQCKSERTFCVPKYWLCDGVVSF